MSAISSFFSLLSRQERLLQYPHLIEGNRHHDKKPHRHEDIPSKHGEYEERRDITDQPGRDQVQHHAAERHPRRALLDAGAGRSEIQNVHENHKDDRHRKEVKMGHFGQLSKRHRFTECCVGSPIMIGNALWRKSRHAVRPKEGKEKAYEHQEQEQGIQKPNVPIRISKAEPGIEISHGREGIGDVQFPKRKPKNPLSDLRAATVSLPIPAGFM